ncbi:MAG: biotin/lipoyl-binding protein [Oscillospiraceae bacterium]|jgi:HlyD family secretion protein|nr:biotin/lipoyl-binding protein [Oscillospiraceae bacterium]
MKPCKTRRAAAAAALLLSLILPLAGCGEEKNQAASGSAATKQVAKGDLVVGLTADGTVALPVTNLNFEVEGTVNKLHVAAGDTVKKGDLLVELDDSDYQLAIETAQNTLDKAQTNYADALWSYSHNLKSDQQSLQNAKTNLSSGFDSFDYDNAVTEAKRTLEKRKTELAEAEKTAKNPYDSLASDRQLADANATLAARLKELSDATATARNPFDATSYQRQIDDAAADVTEKTKALATAKAEGDSTAVSAAQKALDTAQTKLTRLKEDMASAKTQAAKDASAKLETAQKNYDSAVQSLQRLKEDIALAKTEAAKKANDALATAQQNVTDAQNALTKAEKNLEKAKKDFTATLSKDQAAYNLQLESYAQAEKGSTAVSNAASAVKDAELALQEAKNRLEKTKITAPLDGAVINVSKKEGEKVSASSNPAGGMAVFGTSGSSSAVVTVCDLSAIYLTANITEGDIVGVEAGQVVRVQIDSIGEESFSGSVLTVSSLPSTDSSGITTYTVTVKLDQADSVIKDGMAALLTFVRLEHKDVLLVPNKAVFLEDGKQYVNVVVKSGYEKREVSCGLTNGTESEVLSGLAEGDTVAVGTVKTA